MRQSNGYIIGFAALMTVVLGGLLALAATALKPAQQEAVKLDTRSKILSAVMDLEEGADVNAIWEERIDSKIVNIDGDVVERNEKGEAITAERIDVGREYKKPAEERLFPVFMYKPSADAEVENYILPVYGNGLWDRIWGFVALEKDLVTVKGIRFDHKGETPGLGARITDAEVQDRYINKKIYNDIGELVAIEMVKGEAGDPSIYNDYQVDGLSGATMTAIGVNNMLKNYLSYYESYFKTLKGEDNKQAMNSSAQTL